MDGVLLGKRIREERLKKKMTQAQVAGDFITRNMLSQIESGIACPSIKTLEHLAKTLDLSMSELLPGAAESAGEDKEDSDLLGRFVLGKDFLLSGDYISAIERLSGLNYDGSPLKDEAAALLARAYYKESEILRENERYKSAVAFSEKAAALTNNEELRIHNSELGLIIALSGE